MTSGPSPCLAVHLGSDVPAALTALLTAAAPWAEVVAASVREPLPERVRAHLYTSDVLPRRPHRPYGVWQLPGADPVDVPGGLLMGEPGAGAPRAAVLVCLLPWPDRGRPVLPFTRARYRSLRGLPESVVAVASGNGATWGPPGATPVRAPDGTWPTVAALASSVIARGSVWAWSALAWAAPTVTDPETAERLSLTPGEHVLVGADPAARRELASALAADEPRAAGLAQRGWAAARERRPERAAARMAGALGLGPRHDLPTASRLIAALDELDTPSGSRIRRRARAAVAMLPGAVTAGWRPEGEEQR